MRVETLCMYITGGITIRKYAVSDWMAVEKIHDSARKVELQLAGLEAAFVPLKIAAKREGLFEYPGLYVAEEEGAVTGFIACTEEELAWLYVAPACMRKGTGRSLAAYALKMFPDIHYIEVLKGNEPARKLYESMGFTVTGTDSGRMPGNEAFEVKIYVMQRL